jgi:excisionase family DNA binding protein
MTVPLFMTDDPRKWIIAARKLHEMIQAGELKPGDQLPGRALLAARLGVRPGTLARAIRDLDACGVLCHGRSGRTWVAPEPSPPEPAQPEPAAAPVVILPGHRPTLTVAECASSARVSKRTVYRLIQAGAVEATQVAGRFRVIEDSWRKYLATPAGASLHDPCQRPDEREKR